MKGTKILPRNCGKYIFLFTEGAIIIVSYLYKTLGNEKKGVAAYKCRNDYLISHTYITYIHHLIINVYQNILVENVFLVILNFFKFCLFFGGKTYKSST